MRVARPCPADMALRRLDDYGKYLTRPRAHKFINEEFKSKVEDRFISPDSFPCFQLPCRQLLWGKIPSGARMVFPSCRRTFELLKVPPRAHPMPFPRQNPIPESLFLLRCPPQCPLSALKNKCRMMPSSHRTMPMRRRQHRHQQRSRRPLLGLPPPQLTTGRQRHKLHRPVASASWTMTTCALKWKTGRFGTDGLEIRLGGP